MEQFIFFTYRRQVDPRPNISYSRLQQPKVTNPYSEIINNLSDDETIKLLSRVYESRGVHVMLKDLVKSRLTSIYSQGKELEDEAVKEIQAIMDELPLVDEKSMELEEWGLPVLVPSPEGDVEGGCPTENMVVGESASESVSASGGLREYIEKEIEAVVEALPSMEAEYRKAILLLAFLPNRLDDRYYRRLSDLGHQMQIFSPELLPLQPPQPPQHPQQLQPAPHPQPPQRRKRTFTLTVEMDDGELEQFKAGGSPMQQDDPLIEEIKEEEVVEKVALHDIKWEEEGEEEGGYLCLANREEEKEERKIDEGNNNIKWGREEEDEDEMTSINRFPAWSVAVGGFISKKRKRGASDDVREERHRGEEKEKEKMKEEEEDVDVEEEEGGGEGRLYHPSFQAHHHPFHPWQLPLSIPMYNNTTQHLLREDRKPQHPQLQHVQQQIPIWQQHFPPVWGQQPQHPLPPPQQPQNVCRTLTTSSSMTG